MGGGGGGIRILTFICSILCLNKQVLFDEFDILC